MIVKRYSAEPRRMMKLAPVPIKEGGVAEFILFNPDRLTTFSRDFMKSKSINTPFLDQTLQGMIERVLYPGQELLARSGSNSRHFHRLTLLAPAGKAPDIRETGALDGLDGLDEAGVHTLQKKAFAVRLVDDRKAGAIGIQTRAVFNKLLLFTPEVTGNLVDLLIRHIHITRPAAAIPATHALIVGLGISGRRSF